MKLQFKFRKILIKFSENVYDNWYYYYYYQLQNYWIEDLQEITCQEKESKVEFICRYSEQNVRPQWFKNTSEIFHGHKYNFINDDGLFRLVIQRITKEDSGKYTCQADDKQTSAYLNVRGRAVNCYPCTRLTD